MVIRVAGASVHWASIRQSGTVLSAHESELSGARTGTHVGIAIRGIVHDMTETTATLMLAQDSKATTSTVMHEVTSWRTRHYALRAAGIRGLTADRGITVELVRRVSTITEPLTHVMPKVKLMESCEKRQLIKQGQPTLWPHPRRSVACMT